MNITAFITGATGFVGGRLFELCAEEFGHDAVVGFARHIGPSTTGMHPLDLSQEDALKDWIVKLKPTYLFHLAGMIKQGPVAELLAANVNNTINVLEAVKRYSPHTKVILAGSAAEYGNVTELPITENTPSNPISDYGLSKKMQTDAGIYYGRKGVNVCIGRIFNILGPKMPAQSAIYQFREKLLEIRKNGGDTLYVGNIYTKRDYLDVTDVARALIALAKSGKSGEIYNICSGKSYEMHEILQIMISGLQLKNLKVATDNKFFRADDIKDSKGDNTRLLQATNWKQLISLEGSVDHIINT